MNDRFDFEKIMEYIINHSKWHTSYIHGMNHWRNVERNGLFLVRYSGIDPDLMRLFAIFHDSMRQNEGYDLEHGPLAAELIEKVNPQLLNLGKEELHKLMFACKHHTDTNYSNDPFIGSCWDADRLDIGRVGKCVNSDFMSTTKAKALVDRNMFSSLDEYEYVSVIK